MSQQFIGIFSDHDDKKLMKFMLNGVFYGRKFLKLKEPYFIFIQKLFKDRIANKFSCIKTPYDFVISQYSADILTVTFPFFDHQPLLDYILAKSQFNSLTDVLETVLLTMLRGQNEYFYSYENILLNPFTFELTFAPFSIVGILPLYFRTSFSRRQFTQVFQLLDEEMFEAKVCQISYKIKFRAIGMLILHLIMKKRISLILQGDIKSDHIEYAEALQLVKQLKSRFERLLIVPYAIKLIQEASDRDRVDYFFFLKRVFIDKCSGMTWKTVKDCLIPKRKSADQQNCLQELFRKKYDEEDQFANERLVRLGILDSEPDIYMVYKLQIPKLNFDKPKDLITREKYVSSNSINMFKGIAKLFMKPADQIITNEQSNASEPLKQMETDYYRQQQMSRSVITKVYYQLQSSIKQQDRQIIPHVYHQFADSNKQSDKLLATQKFTSKIVQDEAAQIKQPSPQDIQFLDIHQESNSTCPPSQEDFDSVFSQLNSEFIDQSQHSFVIRNVEQKKIQCIIKLMSNNLKTNMVELKGKKIYALDPRMGLINRYFCL